MLMRGGRPAGLSLRMLALIVVGLLATEGALVTVALAHVKAFGSGISIDHQDGNFFGAVSSKRKKCKRRRQVIVRKSRPQKSDIVIGSTRTNATGGWSVSRGSRTGDFYAVVKRRTTASYGHSHKCRRAISKHIKVHRKRG